MKALQAESGMGMVIITHDLGLVDRIADHVIVMNAGQVVERGPVAEVLSNPQHPYTHKLLDAVPGRHGFSRALAVEKDAAPSSR